MTGPYCLLLPVLWSKTKSHINLARIILPFWRFIAFVLSLKKRRDWIFSNLIWVMYNIHESTHIYIFISMMLIVSMHTTIANLTYNFLATNTSTRPIQKLQGISSRQRIILLWYCVYALKHFSSFLNRFVPIKFNEKGCRSKT